MTARCPYCNSADTFRIGLTLRRDGIGLLKVCSDCERTWVIYVNAEGATRVIDYSEVRPNEYIEASFLLRKEMP